MSDQLRVAQQIHSEDWEEAVSPDSRLPYSARSVLESSKPGICCSQKGKEAGICAVSEPHCHSDCAVLRYVKLNSSY